MKWDGKDIVTIGDLGNAMVAIFKRRDPDEARRFMAAYRAENEHADTNVGYMTGYYGDGEAMRQFFGTAHPMLGMYDPTPEEAFEMGKNLAAGG